MTIRVENLVQHYGVRPVLRDVTLEIPDGELLVIMGPNGMGKTTLLAAIGGALSPQRGHVAINGLVRRGSEENELAIRRQCVFLPADAWLPLMMTGREFLLAVGRLYDVDDERLMEHAAELLKLFDLEHQGDTMISSYSTGQQKKIALCSALVTGATTLLLDEPFSGGLDPSGIHALKNLLKHLAHEEGRTLVISTPVPELVEELADRIAILAGGRIIACDTADGLRRASGCDGPLGDVYERLIAAWGNGDGRN